MHRDPTFLCRFHHGTDWLCSPLHKEEFPTSKGTGCSGEQRLKIPNNPNRRYLWYPNRWCPSRRWDHPRPTLYLGAAVDGLFLWSSSVPGLRRSELSQAAHLTSLFWGLFRFAVVPLSPPSLFLRWRTHLDPNNLYCQCSPCNANRATRLHCQY